MGKPRYYHILYNDQSNRRQFEWVRLVVRKVDGAVDDLAVVRRLVEVPSIPECSLSSAGCKSLAWLLEGSTAAWPALTRVPLTSVLRVGRVVPEIVDLSDRRGLRAVPSNTPDTAAKRHAQRFFTNDFFPSTSRLINPGS